VISQTIPNQALAEMIHDERRTARDILTDRKENCIASPKIFLGGLFNWRGSENPGWILC
jgi:hypothetical protein